MSADLLERLKSALSDRYSVESEIGRGGMATVFLAEDLKHHRKVAIKVLHPELGAAVGGERFGHEIEIVSGLTHPHVVPLFDSGETDGLLFYVMPYVEGESLRERLDRETQFPVEEAIRLTEEIADALHHAHGQGVIHRDIKPANILLEGGHAIVADFGLARAVSAAGGENVTATGMAVGTPAYMSPEQASGEEVDERSDLYALGCILYEMLAGEPPLTGATPQSTAAKRLTDRPTPLGAIRNTVPAGLQSLVQRMLATSAVDRPATARELADELEEVRRSPGRAARRASAPRWLVPVIGLAAVSITVAVVSMLGTDRSLTRDVRLLPAGADLGERSIAVLPFAINTGADSDDWLRTGLAGMLTTDLSQLETIRVVTVERLLDLMRQAGREGTDRIPEDMAVNIASASGARAMVNGSLVRLGDDFRLDVQLTDVSDGTIISAEQASGSDVFALVNDVTKRLLSQVLGEKSTPTELTPLSQLATGNLDAYREYHEGLLARQRWLPMVAEEHFQRAVELDSTFALAWLRLGMMALWRGDYQLASSHLDRTERHSIGASERDRLVIQAGRAQASRNWDEAIGILEEVVTRYPDDAEALFQLGLMHRFADRLEDNRRTMEDLLALDPYHPGALNELANQAAAAGDEATADSMSLRYIEAEPDQWNPYDTRAEILWGFGRIEEAREMDRETIRRNPGYPTPYNRLISSYLRDGDVAGARAALEPFRENPTGAAMTRWMEADTYVTEGRYPEAFDANRGAADKASELGRDHFLTLGWDVLPMILRDAGVAAHARGDYKEAEATFRDLRALYPESALFGLLGTYGKQERFEEMIQVRDVAAADAASAAELGRRSAERRLHFADGLISWYRGDAESAAHFFGEGRAASGMSKTDYRVSMGIEGEEALALLEVGRISDALGIIDEMEAVGLGGWGAILAHTAWYLRGRAYEALGESEQALESYQQLLDVAGDRVREVVLFRDTPERVARLRGEN